MKDVGEVVAVDRSHNKVLDIQKLAAEMGLTCITTYKLDALKSVCRGNEPNNVIDSSDLLRLHLEKASSIAVADHAPERNGSNRIFKEPWEVSEKNV